MDGGAAITLVNTKLTAPTAPTQLVARPRLEAALVAALEDASVRVVLISAPAGSGKSTLTAAALADTEESIAWLQADQADSDPARFWSHAVAAFSSCLAPAQEALEPLAAGAGADPAPLLEALVNHLSVSPTPTVLVIDDYHLISSPAAHDSVEQLISLAPNNFTLVLSTRVDPSLRLSRLRLSGELVEIRADDLRFATDEATQLLGRDHYLPEPRHVVALCERTEGWAAGLVLAGMSLAATEVKDAFVAEFHGNDRLVVDYLSEEFLSTVAADDLDRLLRTSILDRLCGSLVDALCDTTDGAAWLRQAASTNQMLISLDHTGTWFRYHHLLGDLLLLQANSQLGPNQLADLHGRAGKWHHRNGNAHQAVEHYSRGGHHRDAADLIYDEAADLLSRGQLATLLEQINRLGSLADEHVGTLIVRGWIAQLTGSVAEAQRCLALAQQFGPNNDQLRLVDALTIATELAVGDVGSALVVAQNSAAPTEAAQASALASAHTWGGDFETAARLLRSAEQLASEQGNSYVAVGAPIYRAIAAIDSGNASVAREMSERAVEIAKNTGLTDATQLALAHSVRSRSIDDIDLALSHAHRGIELARKSASALTLAYALTSAGDVMAHHGHGEAIALLQEARGVIDRCPDPGVAGRYLARVEARHHVTTERPATPELVDQLTERELAVLHYLPSKLSQREIAAELYVSLNTVKTHCKAIYRKLGVGDRKAAIQTARDLNLI